MLGRGILRVLQRRLDTYPAVALVGPRQSGKTTLGRSLSSVYFDLEHEPDRLAFDLEWPERQRGKPLVVLDEAQTWPEIFPLLRSAIDLDRDRSGRFLILGSVSPAIMTHVSGRLRDRATARPARAA